MSRKYTNKLLEELNLYNETLDEYTSISKLDLTITQQSFVKNKIEKISIKNLEE